MLEVDDEGGRMFLRVLLHLTMHDYPPLVSGALQLLFKHFSQRQEAMHTFKQVGGAGLEPRALNLTGMVGWGPRVPLAPPRLTLLTLWMAQWSALHGRSVPGLARRRPSPSCRVSSRWHVMPDDQGWHLASAHDVLGLATSLHWFPRIPLAPSACDTTHSPLWEEDMRPRL